jgi:hypothetical protein
MERIVGIMPEQDWYPAHAIKYTRQQVIWLLSLLPSLRDGSYLPNPKESGYTKAPIGKSQINSKATFITPAEIYSELTNRIETAGEDGLWLEMAYSCGIENRFVIEQHIASATNSDINEIDKRVQRALTYISGKYIKERNYQDWKYHRKGQ